MAGRIALILAMVAVVSGCNSRFNPFNWFGGSRSAPEIVTVDQVAIDPRPIVDQVIALSVDRAPGGAILTATGLPPRQGYWSAALLQERKEPGILSFQFRLAPPPVATPVVNQTSREVMVSVFISDQTLSGVREIRVLGARASRSVRR